MGKTKITIAARAHTLAACGEEPGTRAVTGGLFGAGAVGGAVTAPRRY